MTHDRSRAGPNAAQKPALGKMGGAQRGVAEGSVHGIGRGNDPICGYGNPGRLEERVHLGLEENRPTLVGGLQEERMSVGPVEYMIVAFPGNQFKGEIIPALQELVDNGTIRILDLILITKDANEAAGRNATISRTEEKAPAAGATPMACAHSSSGF